MASFHEMLAKILVQNETIDWASEIGSVLSERRVPKGRKSDLLPE
jgi:hypothetical protein